jgi:hypothetical protein
MNPHPLRWIALAAAGLLLGLAAACVPATPAQFPTTTPAPTRTPAPATPTAGAPITGTALVEGVDVLILESFPVQAQAVVRGSLPDACTTLVPATITRQGNTFSLVLATTRPAEAACAQVLTPFEHTLPLDVAGLPRGIYTVDANGVQATFELAVDNVLPSTASAGLIGGLVWEDFCNPGGEGEPAPTAPPLPCVAAPGGGFVANGLFDNGEIGLPGVVMALGQGACPSAGLATTTTGPDGRYAFTGLAAGDYCVSIDPLTEPNLSLLIPGTFTFPALEQGSADVTLAEAEQNSEVHLAWDYQLK